MLGGTGRPAAKLEGMVEAARWAVAPEAVLGWGVAAAATAEAAEAADAEEERGPDLVAGTGAAPHTALRRPLRGRPRRPGPTH